MMYTMPKNFLSICVNFALATQRKIFRILQVDFVSADGGRKRARRDIIRERRGEQR